MGLDMNPLPRPKPGHEAEFEQTWRSLNIAFGKLPDPEAALRPKRGFWGTLRKGEQKQKPVDTAPMVARFEDISEPHWSQLGAPVVGQDDEADAWVRDLWAQGILAKADKDETSAIKRLAGTHVLELLPDCDGFPNWTGSSGERCSLRGQILNECEAILSQDLIGRAWQPMLASELAAWSGDLFAALERAREQRGILPDGRDTQLETTEGQANAVECAAKWARYWSARGHGSDPDY
jgi:hypothetical protein